MNTYIYLCVYIVRICMCPYWCSTARGGSDLKVNQVKRRATHGQDINK